MFAAWIVFAVVGPAQAQVPAGPIPLSVLRKGQEKRLPALDALKTSGVVGENNQGFVEVRGHGSDYATNLVADENHDRAVVYTLYARKYDIAPEQVGRLRAKKVAEKSKPGIWLQAPDGTWYQKKAEGLKN
ncbi:MAG TPA: YdbL family protein [Opitutaceae bacterium]|nr:YdbL family protein [Opitutaceae bacterium]